MSLWTIAALIFAVLFLASTFAARRAVYIIWTGGRVVYRPTLYAICVVCQWLTLVGLIVSVLIGEIWS